jgi:5-methylcytosine-specific restriction enzyme subunit McrC
VGPEIELVEGGEAAFVQIDDSVLDALVASDLVDVEYRAAAGVAVVAKLKVGVARVGPTVVRIRPKIPIHRIFWLLGFTTDRGWRSGPVPFAVINDLVTALADAYLRHIEPALDEGPLQGYHEVDDSLTVIRGRVREQEQLRRQFGIPVPIHVRYEEFSADIAENRILRTAAYRLVRLPGLDGALRTRLRHVEATLGDASLLEPGGPLPAWRETRLNQRFHLALWLAEMIIRHTSLDQPHGAVHADGFIVDMAKVFEDFVTKALGAALEAIGGKCVPQRRQWLDHDNSVELKPDLTWFCDGKPAAVMDAKYKAEKPAGFSNADTYQMLAYCTALGLGEGHLVYAKGNESERSTLIRNSGVAIHCHTLDLDSPPTALLEQVDRIALTISTAREEHGPSSAANGREEGPA